MITKNFSRVCLLISAALLSLTYFFPLWKIGLTAPQYPEGLNLNIHLSKVTGDLGNINILNHYIGMHKIIPEEIPELRIFIWIFSALIITAIVAALFNKRWMLYGWTAIFLVFSLIALVDFYNWEYKYGHELNPDAAIIMEGETYQPPLIGTKDIMNITATSWPGLGGMGHMAALILVLFASVKEFKNSANSKNKEVGASIALAFIILPVFF
ncbi:MAG: hypothetical protein ABL927_07470 [Bdellovibrionales bacterium]